MSRTPRVWVIDDDAELRKLLDEYLSTQGFDVRALPDAHDLQRRLARERPDLLVLDVMLPGADGLEVCRGLREARDDIPIIMLTAKSDPIDRIVGMELGADDYVGKPFLPRELTARIHAVLRRRSPLPPGAPVANGNTLAYRRVSGGSFHPYLVACRPQDGDQHRRIRAVGGVRPLPASDTLA